MVCYSSSLISISEYFLILFLCTIHILKQIFCVLCLISFKLYEEMEFVNVIIFFTAFFTGFLIFGGKVPENVLNLSFSLLKNFDPLSGFSRTPISISPCFPGCHLCPEKWCQQSVGFWGSNVFRASFLDLTKGNKVLALPLFFAFSLISARLNYCTPGLRTLF